MQYFRSYIFTVYTVIKLWVMYKYILHTHTNKIIKEVNDYLKTKGFEMSSRRIKKYQLMSYWINNCFCTMRGYRIGFEEARELIFLGILASTLDDLGDLQNMTNDEILELLRRENPDTMVGLLAVYAYKKVQHKLSDEFYKYFFATLISQEESLKQLQVEKLTDKEIEDITFEKGRLTCMAFRLHLYHPLIEGEEKAVFMVGELLQFNDDVIDIYENHKSNLQTLLTNTTDIQVVIDKFIAKKDETVRAYKKLNYKKRDLRKSMAEVIITLAFSMTLLQQLLDLQGNGEFKIEKYTKKQLTIDMSSWSNVFKIVRHATQFNMDYLTTH